MEQNCKNCNQIIITNFCENCGQKKYKRIDKKYIWDELQYTFLHVNKGFLFTAKKVLANPGKTAKEFIEGNRVNHYKPILFLFLLSGISAFISFKILGLKEIMDNAVAQKPDSVKMMSATTSFLSSYSSLIVILFIPFMAFASKVALRKWGHNFYEHVVMNTYLYSFYTLITILVVYPIMFFLKKSSPSLVLSLANYSMIFFPFLLAWFFKAFYNEKSWKSIILKTLLITFLILVIFFITIVLIVVGVLIFTGLTNPNGLSGLKQGQ